MAEAMSEERLARLRADNEPIGDHLSGLTADEVGELLDEVERLHAQLAEIGETEVEWGYRLRDDSGNSTPWAPLGGREIATAMVNMKREQGSDARLGQRLAGEWREVER